MAARKTVSVVFCDIVDSTPLGERIDPEVHRRIQERYFDAVRAVFERHGGTVEKFIGDAAMAAFGIPVAHDDDGLRAVRAASDLRPAVAELNEGLERDFGVEISVRIGVNTGEVVAGDPSQGQAFATGDAVATAQRLEAAAQPGEILIGDTTYRLVSNAVLVEPVEPLVLKGKAEPVEAWRLVGVVEGAEPFPRRLDTPLVGREQELAMLRAELDAAIAERRCRLATVVGPAGIGKSRLGNELVALSAPDATALVGRCLAYGEGVTYWPLRGILLAAAGGLAPDGIAELLDGAEDGDRIASLLAAAVGSSEAEGGSEGTFWAVRRFLEHLAAERPLIVGVDELQWAEPTLLDLLEYLAGWSRGAPILLLGLSRPELLDRRPGWPVTISLGPLPPVDAERLADLLDAPQAGRERITAAAEGNPLFLEQLVALEAEHRQEEIPATIHAILAARLDRLEPSERSVLEHASVIGREFTQAAVAALAEEPVGGTLLALVRRELVEPDPVAAQDGFRFRHVLIRDAAYLALAKERRADLHRRYAEWLGSAGELDELVGYHLEQAFLYGRELGALDVELAARAGRRLGRAGVRAVRLDLPAAVSLLERAGELLDEGDPELVSILPQLGSTLLRMGDVERAREVFTRALAAAEAAGDRAVVLRTRLDLLFCETFTEPEKSLEETKRLTAEVVPELERLGDHVGLSRAWRLRSDVFLNACLWEERATSLRRALEHARMTGDPVELASTAMALGTALYYGPTPVDDALGECAALLESEPDNRTLEAALTAVLGGLQAMRGNEAGARELWGRSRTLSEQLGQRFRRAGIALFAADVELLSGRLEEAAAVLRWSTQALGEMGISSTMSTHAAVLSELLGTLGEYAEAEKFAQLSQELAAPDDVMSQAYWRMGRARALAGQGGIDAAEALARAAVELAERTDAPDLRARSLLTLARVTGEPQLVERARRLYLDKGSIAAAEHLAAAPTPS